MTTKIVIVKASDIQRDDRLSFDPADYVGRGDDPVPPPGTPQPPTLPIPPVPTDDRQGGAR
jgi:hypothetical protein